MQGLLVWSMLQKKMVTAKRALSTRIVPLIMLLQLIWLQFQGIKILSHRKQQNSLQECGQVKRRSRKELETLRVLQDLPLQTEREETLCTSRLARDLYAHLSIIHLDKANKRTSYQNFRTIRTRKLRLHHVKMEVEAQVEPNRRCLT